MNIGLQTQLFIFRCKVNDKFGIGETEFFTYK